ncbi:MAG: SURF1 family protein, partial [Gammaproteobacteria bacterium]|nr:SURF1 family protein [Gammaproteobacteria bacterium]
MLLPTLVFLGFWQLDRAEQKRSLLAEFELKGVTTLPLSAVSAENAPRYQRVETAGVYDEDRQFLLDAMTGSGGAGYQVLSLLYPHGSGLALLVNRGWIPAGGDRSALPVPAVPAGRQTLNGRLANLPRPGIELQSPEATADSWPRLVLFPTIEELERALGLDLYPLVLWLDADAVGGFERDWRPVNATPDKHLAYA